MPSRAYVTLLLGGVVQVPFFPTQDGKDGWVTSAGMLILRSMLQQLPGVTVYTTNWGNWQAAGHNLMQHLEHDTKQILIGYSGGGTRATYLAQVHWLYHINKLQDLAPIDLMVLYDPSPEWQMEPIQYNVKQVVCYHNLKPMMPSPYGPLGGGSVTLAKGNDVTKVSTKNIAEQHLLVQKDMALHRQTVNLVKALIQ